jgi:hypothetical protein
MPLGLSCLVCSFSRYGILYFCYGSKEKKDVADTVFYEYFAEKDCTRRTMLRLGRLIRVVGSMLRFSSTVYSRGNEDVTCIAS